MIAERSDQPSSDGRPLGRKIPFEGVQGLEEVMGNSEAVTLHVRK